MNSKIISIVLLIIMVFTGCSNDQFELNEGNPPDRELSVYLPSNGLEFMGEGGYYHYYKTLETEEFKDRIIVTITGEVKDYTKSTSKNDYDFKFEIWSDSEKMIQTSSGHMLNETEFDRLILLRTPIVEDASWEFEAYDKLDNKHIVTGKIIEIDKETGTIVVEYTTDAGNYEKRTLKKNYGTTSFIKQIAYKDAVTYSGYHMNQIETIPSDELDEDLKYDRLEVVEID